MRLPDLIIAGAPKSGTSSVFRWLADHPDVVGSTEKETYFFVDPGTHMYDPLHHFTSGGPSGFTAFFPPEAQRAKIVIESTPSYLYQDLALREIPRLPSKPHVVFLLREPVSQIKSLYTYFRENWNWIPADMSFPAFVEASRAGTHDFKGNELARHAVRNGAYVDFLLRWREACGSERVHVFLFDEFVADERGFMRRLAVRFGIDPSFYDDYAFPRENETYAVRLRPLQDFNVFVRKYLPKGRAYEAVRWVYRALNTRKPQAEPADPSTDSWLRDYYAEPNARLAAAFGLDLSGWAPAPCFAPSDGKHYHGHH